MGRSRSRAWTITMRTVSTLLVASLATLMLANSALAQPRPYTQGPPSQGRFPQGPQQNRGPGAQAGGQYYYNGRWVDGGEWQRHNAERDRWARSYRQRRGDESPTSAIAGIIGFALGAAIIGSSQQAAHARAGDANWSASCARRYRSFDRASGTYLGFDGARHYCQ